MRQNEQFLANRFSLEANAVDYGQSTSFKHGSTSLPASCAVDRLCDGDVR